MGADFWWSGWKSGVEAAPEEAAQLLSELIRFVVVGPAGTEGARYPGVARGLWGVGVSKIMKTCCCC